MKIVYNNKVHLIFTALLFSLLIGLTACQPEMESDLPASAARDWLIAANGIYTQKAVALTCSDKEEELLSNRETGAARYIIISKNSRSVIKDFKFDASGVEFNIVSLEPDEAVVEAKGEVLITAGEGNPSPIELDERWLMILEEGEWKWCGYFTQD
jgi:hypothetical protein